MKYVSCSYCDASFRGSVIPRHRFLGKMCPGVDEHEDEEDEDEEDEDEEYEDEDDISEDYGDIGDIELSS